jgi:short-subunit dehydrogenase
MTPKSILITGCSSGIGHHVALGLKQRGYRVFASARKAVDVDALRKSGLEALQLDLTDPESIGNAVKKVLINTDENLYALFNNGAYGQFGAVEDLSRDALREQFETNVFGWHELTAKIIPFMRKRGAGRIIQNSSVLGIISLRYRGAYSATKYAIEGLSDTLRLELRGSGISVSLIEPGPIISRFRENSLPYFLKYIDTENSVHREQYLKQRARLEKKGAAQAFTLPPEAVLKRVIHALESKHPKARYPVTFPTYLFTALKRILPASALDTILSKVN